MVCLGNICRSPIAEGLMAEAMKVNHVEGMVDSAGLLSYHQGSAPDRRAIKTAKDRNIDISCQQSRPIQQSDFEKFDYIFAMDIDVYRSVMSQAGSEAERKKVFLFLEYAGYPKGSEVPDPYYSGNEAFVSTGTEGKPDDYFIYTNSTKELKLVSKKNFDEVVAKTFAGNVAAIDKAKTANGDVAQLKEAVDVYNARNK